MTFEMCMNEQLAKGIKQGRAEGRAEGLADGAAQELRRTVASLKEKFSLEEIANLLGRPLSEIESAAE